MSRNYDNWERLVRVVLRREQDRELARADSTNTSFSSISTALDFDELSSLSLPRIEDNEERNSSNWSYTASSSTKAVETELLTASSDLDKFEEAFYIPDYIFEPNSTPECSFDMPKYPVLVFINSKSGGLLTRDLLMTYRSILNKNQVFDLGEEAPDNVLHKLYVNLERLKLNGDEFAAYLERNLKIAVAGGDGTAGWLLGVVSDLKLSQPPPIAIVPLGTENNLAFALGWGKKNPETYRISVLSFLDKLQKAKEMMIDSWHILIRMKVPKEGSCDPIAPLELPHSLHAFQRVSSTDAVDGEHTFRGGFWSYFSIGMDAQVSHAFHSQRKLHPEKFKNQMVNQSAYARLGLGQGWFLAPLVQPPSKNIAQLAKVMVIKRHGNWQDLSIPDGIMSIICLNLSGFSGEQNPWGTPNAKMRRDRDLTPPYVDDGCLEIVGLRNAWHGLVLRAPNGRGTRLAQAHRIRFVFHKGAADHTFMSIDGEPWKQPLPVDDEIVVVEISHLGRVKVLATQKCRSTSVFDPSSPYTQDVDEKDSDNEDEFVGEEWRKFGAADTFKIPYEVDISHLS